MHYRRLLVTLFLVYLFPMLWAQQISKEELVWLTPKWTGERFEDGRPKVPDAILKRMKLVTLEEAWAVRGKRRHRGHTLLALKEPSTRRHNRRLARRR